MAIILSIDASTKSTGIAIFQQNKLIKYKCINCNDSNTYKRIEKMTEQIKKIYNQYKPINIIMEDVLPEDVKHNQTVFKALIYLQASIVLSLYKLGGIVNLCTASHWRAQVGIHTGRGIKREVLKNASKELVKNIYKVDVNDDISDAICIGIAYITQNKSAF